MKLLGLDLSLTATGWAVLVDGQVEAMGVINSKPNPDRIARYDAISGEIIERATNFYLRPAVDMAVVEGYSFGARGDALTGLSELRGILLYKFAKLGLLWQEIPPGRWRKAVLGKGSMPKDMVRVELLKRYALEHDDLNALEAFGVAYCAHLEATGQVKPAIKRGRAA